MFRLAAHSFGPPSRALQFEPAPKPALAPGAVLVRMLASPINPSDLIPIAGAYPHRTALPFVPGFEGVGVVEAVGADIDPAMIGRRVLPLGSAGGWQTWKTLPADWCVEVPADIEDDDAAVSYINPLTAMLMLRAARLQPGDRIGINAANSTIGRMLLRMAAAAGIRPIAVVRSEAANQALRGEPAEVVREGVPLPDLAAAFDAVGGPAGASLAHAVKPGGPLLHYGLLSNRPLVDTGRARLTLFRLRDWVHAAPRQDLHAAMGEAFAEIRSGRAASAIAARYPLEAFQDALRHDGRPRRLGKILLQL
jgi:NADPH:quinone reductase-like Zn-dependent oxidoreductase